MRRRRVTAVQSAVTVRLLRVAGGDTQEAGSFQEPASRWLGLVEADAMFHNTLTDTAVVRNH